jgi:hypothetical protein
MLFSYSDVLFFEFVSTMVTHTLEKRKFEIHQTSSSYECSRSPLEESLSLSAANKQKEERKKTEGTAKHLLPLPPAPPYNNSI